MNEKMVSRTLRKNLLLGVRSKTRKALDGLVKYDRVGSDYETELLSGVGASLTDAEIQLTKMLELNAIGWEEDGFSGSIAE